MTNEARTYDTVNLGLSSHPWRGAAAYDTVNVGIESIPYIYFFPLPSGWGLALPPLIPKGQIGAFSNGRVYDVADVTT